MKHLLTTLAGLAMTFMVSNAGVPTTFELKKLDESWNKVAVSTNDMGINIRQKPSVTAPKLVYNEAKIEDFHTPLSVYAYWSSRPARGSIVAVPFTGPGIVAGERSGFYEIYGAGKDGSGWVSAKLCRTYPLLPIDARWIGGCQFLRAMGPDWADLVIYCEFNEMDGDVMFYVGKISGKIIDFPYSLYVENVETGSSRPTSLTKAGDGYKLTVSKAQMAEYDPDIRKFGTDVIADILDAATKSDYSRILYRYNDTYGVETF